MSNNVKVCSGVIVTPGVRACCTERVALRAARRKRRKRRKIPWATSREEERHPAAAAAAPVSHNFPVCIKVIWHHRIRRYESPSQYEYEDDEDNMICGYQKKDSVDFKGKMTKNYLLGENSFITNYE